MRYSKSILSTLLLVSSVASRHHAAHHSLFFNQLPLQSSETQNSSSNDLPVSTREHWMRVASSANYAISPCPFAPFGTAIVNHTLSLLDPRHLGELICLGVNDNGQSSNPTLHGEMVGIGNCTSILTDPEGLYRLSASEAKEAWKSFSLYTTAERPCPMCAGAIAWAEIEEVVYGTSIETLIDLGWSQIEIGCQEVFERAGRLGRKTEVIRRVLGQEMDRWFEWQFKGGECPDGCQRRDEICVPEEHY